MIDLSVVVVSWNTRELTLACLDAAARALRAAPLRAEILLVDNGSRDGTADAVGARLPRVRRIALARNAGFAGGANAGLAAMRGRHALLLNSDARPLGDAIGTCVRFLDGNPDVGLLGPRLVGADGRPERSVHALPRLAAELAPPALHPLLFGLPAPRRAGEPVDVEAVRGAALFARGEAIRRVGPLCEDYFFFLEETEWCLRMQRAGWRVVHHPGVAFAHASGASSKRRHPAETRIEYHRSLYRFYRANAGARSAARVRRLRFAKATLRVLAGAPLAALSARRRLRWRSQRALLAWHLRDCPAGAGLSALEGGA